MIETSLTALLSADERWRLNLLHVVVPYERSCSQVSVFGPFGGPVEASAFADRYTSEIADLVADATDVVVAPLDPGE